MAKMKIYEIARSMQEKFPDLKSKDVVKFLQENGFEAKSAQSTIEDDAIGFLLKNCSKIVIQKRPKNVKEKPAKQERTAKIDNVSKKNKTEKNGNQKKQLKPADIPEQAESEKAEKIVKPEETATDVQTETSKALKEEIKQKPAQSAENIEKDIKKAAVEDKARS